MDEGGASSGHLSVASSLTSSLKSTNSRWTRGARLQKNREIRKLRPRIQEIITLAGEGHGVKW